MDIERDLHRALRRTPAPPDFADRVLARIAEDAQRGRRGNSHGISGPLRWLAAAAAVVMVATGTFRYYEFQRTAAEAERVKQEIQLALQITSEKLALAQQRIERTAQSPSRRGTP